MCRWAKYRMEVTGREPMAIVLEKRRAEREGRNAAEMCRQQQGSEGAACEVGAGSGAKSS